MANTQIILSPPAGSQLFFETDLEGVALTVKGTAGTFYLLEVDNTANGSVEYVKVWYLATAVTVGTTAPDDIYQVPASTKLTIVPGVGGKAFANGMQVACLTTAGTAGTTNPTSAVLARIVYA